MHAADERHNVDNLRALIQRGPVDTTVPRLERFVWPKRVPPLSAVQETIADDFIKHWHHVLPKRYGAIEKFNHTYSMRHLPTHVRWRTLELGAGIGAHLAFEHLDRQDYHCIELRESMAEELRNRYPMVTAVTGDCQQRVPYNDGFFDRVVVIHVLEHLYDLPAALAEVRRVLKPNGIFSVVLPCDPGLLYEFARKISAERIFKARYKIPYRWLIRREHINSPPEILKLIRQSFEIADMTYFPFLIPVINLNLCIGVTAKPKL